MDFLLMEYGVPSLRMFAKKKIFAHMDEVLPSWTTQVFVENLHLQEKLRNVTRDLEKCTSRIRRRKNRTSEALHEMSYVSSKMHEIEIAIRDNRNHYAATELQCLRSLDAAHRELKYWNNLCHVSYNGSIIPETENNLGKSLFEREYIRLILINIFCSLT